MIYCTFYWVEISFTHGINFLIWSAQFFFFQIQSDAIIVNTKKEKRIGHFKWISKWQMFSNFSVFLTKPHMKRTVGSDIYLKQIYGRLDFSRRDLICWLLIFFIFILIFLICLFVRLIVCCDCKKSSILCQKIAKSLSTIGYSVLCVCVWVSQTIPSNDF